MGRILSATLPEPRPVCPASRVPTHATGPAIHEPEPDNGEEEGQTFVSFARLAHGLSPAGIEVPALRAGASGQRQAGSLARTISVLKTQSRPGNRRSSGKQSKHLEDYVLLESAPRHEMALRVTEAACL